MSTYKNLGGKDKPHKSAHEQADLPDDFEQDEDLKALTRPSYAELEAQLNDAEAKLNEATEAAETSRQQALHAMADLENVRKRAEKDVASAHKYGLERLVNDLLPIIDSLERGMSIEIGDNEFAKKMHEGIEMTLSLFNSTLEKFNVKAVNPLNQPFDPAQQQAISTVEDPTQPANTVVQVLQKGYLLNERLIRPALVIVSK